MIAKRPRCAIKVIISGVAGIVRTDEAVADARRIEIRDLAVHIDFDVLCDDGRSGVPLRRHSSITSSG